ncbi:MAG: rod shape-determining protein MreD [Gammaproteobacteria bacterium RIFCSPHIGHO2_12_FULL_41_20]|nr:MAG: rod shape-determining protein MreD [Gammaproteobacteria bacterium RIFCSPHIGHO2_12_FULL_41_20]
MRSYAAIAFSFLVAFILTILPMPDWLGWLRPTWVLMLLIYWIAELPYRINMGVAWVVGFVVDLLNGSVLGEHALAYVIIAYGVIKISHQFRMYPMLQQSLSVFVFILIYQGILYFIQGFVNALPQNGLYWFSPVTSMVFWPWVVVILHDYRYRLRI